MSGAVDLSALKERATAPPPRKPSGDGAVSALPGTVIDVNEVNFESEVLVKSSQVPVIVNLGGRAYEPSVVFTEVLERFAAQAGGQWILANVDVDVSPQIAQAFGIKSVPTVVAVAAGQPLADFEGAQPEEQLSQWFAAVLQATEGKLSGPVPTAGDVDEPEVEDPRFVAAETALDAGDLDGAIAAYQVILDDEPTNAEALNAVRQVKFMARVENTDPDSVAAADADPSNLELQFAAADREMYAQKPETAFARLIGVVARTAGDDKAAARTRLLELFELFDPAEPMVMAARRKLAAALY
ncbi:tetratricopeptide repeat protein [Rhodococcus sp. ARC_M6]|uniref:tetratricopeptide repeat protein n=1 Tax=Rhodococcus sp. ARC_M6 TaxID=2928852 RepID=UPI001FB35BD0|nr:tetratricopeptide repeat protein [Rhodococcus sp. ARC_M6]MCJ0903129.1 tetratricopeptide repeat protein [Rhodococcus sp. ARC_M6]